MLTGGLAPERFEPTFQVIEGLRMTSPAVPQESGSDSVLVAPPAPPAPDQDSVSVLRIAAALLRNVKLILAVTAFCTALAVTVEIVRDDRFVAESLFEPQVAQSPASRLGGVAAQFGIALPTASSGESPQLYAALLRSRKLLRDAALTVYQFPVATESRVDTLRGTLVELYDLPGATAERRLQSTIGMLRGSVSTKTTPGTTLMTLQTSAPWPELAVLLNQRMLQLVNQFNLEQRQSKAAAEQRFVEGRLQEARNELSKAELDLQQFLDRNRSYVSSPQLSFEVARLQRVVELRQQVYLSLAQGYEQARVEAVRNTPVITVVDDPEGSAAPTGRGMVSTVLLGLLIGGFLGVGVAFTRDYVVRQRELDPAHYEEFQQLRRAALNRLSPRKILARPSANGHRAGASSSAGGGARSE